MESSKRPFIEDELIEIAVGNQFGDAIEDATEVLNGHVFGSQAANDSFEFAMVVNSCPAVFILQKKTHRLKIICLEDVNGGHIEMLM